MEVHIDRDTCQGTRYCVMLLEDVFGLDDDGLATLLVPQGSEALDSVREELFEAENLCPTGAITVEHV